MKDEKSKIKVPVSGDSSLPGLQTAAFLFYPYMVERKRAESLLSFYKGTNPFMRTYPHDLF